MSKSYLNFDLLLNEAGDSYQVHVIDSPAGQASRTFTLPFSAAGTGKLHPQNWAKPGQCAQPAY